MSGLVVGATAAADLRVDAADLVPAFGRRFPTWVGMPPVAASMMVIGVMEEACVRIAHPGLKAGETTLGASIDFVHLAPTPQGLQLRASATLVEITDNRLTFQATCHDDLEMVGEMWHVRVIVSAASFIGKVEAKQASTRRPRA